jgi:hypothetical protein
MASDSIFDQSLPSYANYKELKGNKFIQFTKGGYQSLLDSLVNVKYGQQLHEKIKFNHKLASIHVCLKLTEPNVDEDCVHCEFTNDTNKVLARFESGLNVLCKRVILTVSLGVLKAQIKEFIQPNSIIPAPKLESMSKLGYGTANKVTLFL